MRLAIAVAVLIGATLPAPPAAAKPQPELRFATYNVCNAMCGSGKFAWDRRKKAAIRAIKSARPDVLALQELNVTYTWFDLELGKLGYTRVEPLTENCPTYGCTKGAQLYYRTAVVQPLVKHIPNEPVSAPCRRFIDDDGVLFAPPERPRIPSKPRRSSYPTREEYLAAYEYWQATYLPLREAYWQQRQEYAALYRDYQQADEQHDCSRFVGVGRFRLAGSGNVSQAVVGKKALQKGVKVQNFMWAVLRDRRTDAAFTAVSLHLTNEKTPRAERYRRDRARGVVAHLRKTGRTLGFGRTPVVLMGDLNSYSQRSYQQHGAQWIFGRLGFTDAYRAPVRVNGRFPTNNVTGADRNFFPRRPRPYDQPPRLDYLMISKAQPLRYEVHLRLKPNGDFDDRFRGSDHNLVLADVRLNRVKLPRSWRPGP